MKQLLLIALSILCFSAFGQTDATKKIVSISKPNRTEFSPTISADGRTIIYETKNGQKWELYQSHLNDAGTWSEPFPLTSINQKCDFIAGPNLSYDGNTLFYTAFIEGTTQSEDIFYSVRTGDKEWSEPRSIGPPINTSELYEGFPSISSDGSSLYFIRHNVENGFEKKSKEACFIIYVSQKQADGTWGTPEALPPVINSGCVRDPRIMADNHTLIFSSIFADGKGKYDLYQTRLHPDGRWDDPVPLDFINSVDNDQSPCISASGNTMFYYTNNDIYQIAIPDEYRQLINVTVLGTVFTRTDKKPVKARIIVTDKTTGEAFVTESNEADGRYSLVLAAGQSYEVRFTNPEYLAETIPIDLTSVKGYQEQKIDAILEDRYSLSLSVHDKDLKTPVKSFVKLSEMDGTVIFSDSIEGSVPTPFALETSKTYTLGVFAPGYNAIGKAIRCQGELAKKAATLDELIEHEKVKVMADVTDVSSGSKKRLKVTFTNESKDEVIVSDGGEVVTLRKGDRYQVVSNSDKGYSYAIKTITAGEGVVGSDGTYSVPLHVISLVVGAKLDLNHIYFETNSWQLGATSAIELQNIVSLLRHNPGITIEISAHTDDVGSDEYNNNLSQRRAGSVTEYLSKQGIAPKQLVAKGYGKTRPVAPNDTEENKAKNRRVELMVLSMN